MANTINIDAHSQIQEVTVIHNEVSSFARFLRDDVQPNIGSTYNRVLEIPRRVTRLESAKSHFDNLGLAEAVTKAILEKDQGYVDWTATHTADLNSIVSKALTLRTLIENNVAQFPGSYDAAHNLVYVTANQATQDALNGQINDILTHVV